MATIIVILGIAASLRDLGLNYFILIRSTALEGVSKFLGSRVKVRTRAERLSYSLIDGNDMGAGWKRRRSRRLTNAQAVRDSSLPILKARLVVSLVVGSMKL